MNTRLIHKRSIAVAFLFCVLCARLFAQSPNYAWTRSAGGHNNEDQQCVVTDSSGNVYVTGSFWGSSITIGSTVLVNAALNTADLYLVKYDASGNVLWARRAGNTGNDFGLTVTTDPAGNVYVGGAFASPSITFGSTTLNKMGSEDVFIVKYDPSGNAIWAKMVYGNSLQQLHGMTCDRNGNIYVIGYYESSALILGSVVLNNSSPFYANIFIASYDATGNVRWARGGTISKYQDNWGYDIKASANGDIFVTGSFCSDTLKLGNKILLNAGVNGSGQPDLFIAKYDTLGNIAWAKDVGSTYAEWGWALATDVSGNMLITGWFDSPSISFGSIVLTNNSAGITGDIFIAKYDAAGNEIWAKNLGGDYDDRGYGIAVDKNGNNFVTGYFQSDSVNFNVATLHNDPAVNYAVFYTLACDSLGQEMWVNSAVDKGNTFAGGICANRNNDLYVVGNFDGDTLTFGTSAIINTDTGGFYKDAFITKIGALNPTHINFNSETEVRVHVFPNPSPAYFSVDITGASGEFVVLNLTNALGKCLFTCSEKLQSGSLKKLVPVENMAAGSYFLQVNINGKSIVKKIVIE